MTKLPNTAHGTHRLPVDERWRQETPLLGKLPPADYDTAIKVYRTVCKDCQVSCNTNRYLIPTIWRPKRSR